MEAFLAEHTKIFRTPRPNTYMERTVFEQKQELVKVCHRYHQIMQKEPLDENYIQMLTEQIYKRIRLLNRIEHYIDTRYTR